MLAASGACYLFTSRIIDAQKIIRLYTRRADGRAAASTFFDGSPDAAHFHLSGD